MQMQKWACGPHASSDVFDDQEPDTDPHPLMLNVPPGPLTATAGRRWRAERQEMCPLVMRAEIK